MTEPRKSTPVPPAPITVTAVGLLVAAAGIFIQFLAVPEDFPTVPPGPIIMVAAAALVFFGSGWWWTPAVAAAAALMILVGGIISGGLGDNVGDFPAPAIGVVTMFVGLVTAIVAGAVATRRHLRTRT